MSNTNSNQKPKKGKTLQMSNLSKLKTLCATELIDFNSELEEIAEVSTFPSSRMELLLLNLCYKRMVPKEDLKLIGSEQPAAVVRSLKNRGFIWAKDTLGKNCYVRNADGHLCRSICGYEEPQKPYVETIKCSKTAYKSFLATYPDFISGRPSTEIDHRIPQSVIRKFNLGYVDLTDALIQTNNAYNYYQPVSMATNSTKREVCIKCQAGKAIRIPPIVADKRYKISFEQEILDSSCPCLGCVWYDYRYPQGELDNGLHRV